MGGEEREVQVTVKTIGPGRPTTLRIPFLLKVCDLKTLVAEEGRFPLDQLKLVLRGRTLVDENTVRFEDGDTLIAAVIPKPPAKHLQDTYGDDDDDDDDLKFHIPESTNWLKTKIFSFLKDRLRLPDLLLVVIFSISLKAWGTIILWFSLAPVAHRWDLGPLYVLMTGFSIILYNLGRRRQGDASAYSIFNENFRELPGTLNADRIDRDIRAGQF